MIYVLGGGAVPPNRIKTYYWTVPEEVSVSLFDDECLVRHYTSGLGHGNDSFLFGPLKICYEGFSQIVKFAYVFSKKQRNIKIDMYMYMYAHFITPIKPENKHSNLANYP